MVVNKTTVYRWFNKTGLDPYFVPFQVCAILLRFSDDKTERGGDLHPRSHHQVSGSPVAFSVPVAQCPVSNPVCVQSLQSRPTLCSPTDCSPPGSSARGNFQARILEWVAISYAMGSSRPRDGTCGSCVSCVSCIACGFFSAEPWGKPLSNPISPLNEVPCC